MNIHESLRSHGNTDLQRTEFNTRRKIASLENRKNFLQECIEEQVLPSSAPKQFRQDLHSFKESACLFLQETCREHGYKVAQLQSELLGIRLSPRDEARLQQASTRQKAHLKQKIQRLCEQSPWNSAGRVDLVTNISSKPLSNTELQALSLGLKFDTGKDQRPLITYFTKNHKYNDSSVEAGFKQGITACGKSVSPGS